MLETLIEKPQRNQRIQRESGAGFVFNLQKDNLK